MFFVRLREGALQGWGPCYANFMGRTAWAGSRFSASSMGLRVFDLFKNLVARALRNKKGFEDFVTRGCFY